MLPIGTILKHYKRKDVQQAIVEHVRDREVAARFDEQFGKRPDALQYGEDVLELAKQGATSFHCSEERWRNPLQLAPEMRVHELDALRSGWDLILDVDCKNWEYAKLITHLLVKLLRGFGVSTISVKFSGNKGFHIGVPFEAFPRKLHGKETRLYFPDGPRRIAAYLVNLLGQQFLAMVPEKNERTLAAALGMKPEELSVMECGACGMKRQEARQELVCPKCEERIASEERYAACPKCGKLMVKQQFGIAGCIGCGKREPVKRIAVERILEVDTLLISSRHLYRVPYSLHEKSGLVSVPVAADEVLSFERDAARPEAITTLPQFLTRDAQAEEASSLFVQAFDFTQRRSEPAERRMVEVPATAIGEEHFPPCIQRIAQGLGDGRKRAVFVLINFLRSVGWSMEQVEQYLRRWNERNTPPLRENYLVGQLRFARLKKPMLPPNCENAAYYQSMGIKCAENVCIKCKNPVTYAKRRVRNFGTEEGKRMEKVKGERRTSGKHAAREAVSDGKGPFVEQKSQPL